MAQEFDLPSLPDLDEAVQLDEVVRRGFGEGYAVILYDDHYHYREDVVRQLMKALRCGIALANGIVARVEANGKGVVTIASKPEATRVNLILLEIQLKTSLRQVGT